MRILALDDEESYLELYRAFFGLLDEVELVTAGTVDEALAALDRGAFDVVLTDLGVGPGDGRAVVQRIKERGRRERVVVVSGSPGRAVEQELANLGVEKVFTKPFSLAALWKHLAPPASG